MRAFRSRSVLGVAVCLAVIATACGSDGESSTSQADTIVDTTATSDTNGEDDSADAAADTSDCPPIEGTSTQNRSFDSAPPMCLDPDATYTAIITTNKGEFTIELDPDQAPVATNNFVFLARNQYFNETECHRIIPGFVVQCGDPTATGTGGPGYTIIDEPPATGQYEIGSIAMAKTAAPDSAGSQFFIITGEDGAALPPEYALFGQVITGFDETVVVMEAAGSASGTPGEPIRIESITIVQS